MSGAKEGTGDSSRKDWPNWPAGWGLPEPPVALELIDGDVWPFWADGDNAGRMDPGDGDPAPDPFELEPPLGGWS